MTSLEIKSYDVRGCKLQPAIQFSWCSIVVVVTYDAVVVALNSVVASTDVVITQTVEFMCPAFRLYHSYFYAKQT